MQIAYQCRGHQSPTFADGGKSRSCCRARFLVSTSDPLDDGAIVAAASGLPVRGHVHPNDFAAKCTDVEPTNDPEDRNTWRVICKYSTVISDYQTSPTQRPTQYRRGTEYIKKGIASDLDELVIENSAHSTFEEPASIDVPVDTVRCTCIRASFLDSVDKQPFIRHVNSRLFVIGGFRCERGQAILWDLDVEQVEEQGTFFERFEYTFKRRTDLYTEYSSTITPAISSTGVQTVAVASATGIYTGSILTVDTGLSQEEVEVTAVAGSNVTANFTKTHSAGVAFTVKKYDPWQYMPLDMGFETWDAVNERHVAIYAGDQPITHPVLLDGAGERLATWDDEEPVRLLFRVIEEADFSTITFP